MPLHFIKSFLNPPKFSHFSLTLVPQNIGKSLVKVRIIFLCGIWGLLMQIAEGQPMRQPTHKNSPAFIENTGQWNNPAHFMAKLPGGIVYLEKNALHFFFQHQQDLAIALKHPRAFEDDFKTYTVRNHAVRVNFKGSNEDTKTSGLQKQQSYYNYFIGNDPRYWRSRVGSFQQVQYTDLYRNIDAMVYMTAEGGLKYDLVVKPHGDVARICLNYQGQEKIKLHKGRLIIQTSVNSWTEQEPYAYQVINGKTIPVHCSYLLENADVKFSVGEYDHNYPLVIDPELIFSTYSGSNVDNFGHSATYDNDGHLYAAGIVTNPVLFPNGNYPVTPGAFQQVWGGGVGQWPQASFPCDMSISKYTPDGSALVYATYLGGNNNDYPHSLIADHHNNLVIFGTTLSPNFPTKSGCYDVTFNDSFDIVVTKLSADGTQLIGSTYVGGNNADGINTADSLRMNYADEFRGEVIINQQNDIIVASSTLSANFPIILGTYQQNLAGKQDGVIFKLDSNLKVLKASTYFGQTNHDAIYSIDLHSGGDIYFTGGSQSTNFAVSPNTHLGSFKGGFCDGFLGRISSDLSNVSQFRYWGSNSYDQSYLVKVDPADNPVIFGQHFDSIPIINALYSTPTSSLFITKFKTDLDSIIFSTSIGDSIQNNALSPSAFMVDECGVLYGSVWSGTTNRNGNYIRKHAAQVRTTTQQLPITYDAIQKNTDNSDFYLFVMEKSADSILYGTYFGENGDGDHVDGGTSRFDKKGIIYQSVCASCGSGTGGTFLTTPESFSPTNLSPRCSNASFKIDFRKSNIVYAQFDYAPKKFCLDSYIVVTYTNQSYNAQYQYWYVNGVLQDTTLNFTDTIHNVGSYTVKLVAIDSSRCIIIDSSSVTYNVGVDAVASFVSVRDTCTPNITFTNTTTPANVPIRWYFGGGDTSSANIVSRPFPANGLYQILLLANPNSGCADSAVQNLYYDSTGYLVKASFLPPDSIRCEPTGFNFLNTSNKFSNLTWYVNDTFASNDFAWDTIFFTGHYDVKLVSIDSSTCNKSDSSIHQIEVVRYAYPDFTYVQDPCSFTATFTNTTLLVPGDTIGYFWDFGNGLTSAQADTSIQFDTAGRYLVTLVANPTLACEETTTKEVIIQELPGILNAFFTAQPQVGCTPAIVKFTNFSSNQLSQEWYYNDVLKSTANDISDTFYADTVITVKLKVYSNITCSAVDSFESVVTIYNSTHSASSLIRDTCSAQVFFFNHSTTDNNEPINYTWYFGDGDSSHLENPTHTYLKDSLYTILLITNKGSFCADTSSLQIPYKKNDHLLSASYFLTDSNFCAPGKYIAINTSFNAHHIEWVLNNEIIGTDSILIDTLFTPGKYTLTLRAFSDRSCSKVDSTTTQLQVALSGMADFSIARDSCSLLVQFINESISPTGLPIPYIWYFGDGDSSTEKNPVHQYPNTNTYYVTLITNASSTCADSSIQTFFIDGDSTSELIVPNVFTPNSDGLNDCYRLKGVTPKCDEYQFTIYNRWGEVYFKSDNPSQCWNGQNEAGRLASTGVYYYILNLKKYRSEERIKKTGTITLLRE